MDEWTTFSRWSVEVGENFSVEDCPCGTRWDFSKARVLVLFSSLLDFMVVFMYVYHEPNSEQKS